MKLKLIKGKQKELIETYKLEKGHTWKTFSDEVKLKPHILKDLKYEINLIPDWLCSFISEEKDYKKYILDVKNDNWGKIKGGKLSSGNVKKIKRVPYSKKLAELIGIILGDGSVCSYKDYKVGTYQVRVAGHSELDKNYLVGYVKPLIENLFKIGVTVKYSKKNKGMWLIVTGRELVNLFAFYGLKSGNKIKNDWGIPQWIKKNNAYLRTCLRGLVDTDGSIFRMSKKDPNLLRINFTSYGNSLLEDFYNSLILLGYNPHKDSKRVCLSRQKEINRFIEEVGFHNEKHIKRHKLFRSNSPIV